MTCSQTLLGYRNRVFEEDFIYPGSATYKDGKELIHWKLTDDYLKDDTALVYRSSNGLVIITGCSHAGICNSIEYAQKLCNDNRIIDVLGGFHLLEPTDKEVKGTLEYFKYLNLNIVDPCHCTSLDFKIKLSSILTVKEVGVGMVLDYM